MRNDRTREVRYSDKPRINKKLPKWFLHYRRKLSRARCEEHAGPMALKIMLLMLDKRQKNGCNAFYFIAQHPTDGYQNNWWNRLRPALVGLENGKRIILHPDSHYF